MDKLVVIMRGPSGSGKSTYAKKHFPDAVTCSVDDFFYEDSGSSFLYKFDPKLLPQAHASCMSSFVLALSHHRPLIVVDNTNTYEWEYSNYKDIALFAGYNVTLVEFYLKYIYKIRVCARRNKHGVPADIVYKQCEGFEDCNLYLNQNHKVSKIQVEVTCL